MKFKAPILDVLHKKIVLSEITVNNGIFTQTHFLDGIDFKPEGIIVPGFIDSHIHIESSMLTPAQFARIAVRHGTTSAICDPHEIANVAGLEGIQFMIQNAQSVPFDFYFTAPSCVPATKFETSGATLDSCDIKTLLRKDKFVALGEMMNFWGVIEGDKEVLDKIKVADNLGKPVDGHCPLLSGEYLDKYILQNIETDHECSSFTEAIEKKEKSMKIMVRDGSSAKNLESLLNFHDRQNYLKNGSDCFLPIFDFIVSDDKHVGDLIKGHLNQSVKKAINLKVDVIEAIKMVTINPAEFYNINAGAITPGRLANFVLVDNLENLNIQKTYVHGRLVFDGSKTLFNVDKTNFKNTFQVNKIYRKYLDINYKNEYDNVMVNVIRCYDGELLTTKTESSLKSIGGILQPDLDKDILKISVIERYGGNSIYNAFIKGFNLKRGALASSISHDSHNIVVVGTNTRDMANAVNMITASHGGIAIADKQFTDILKLSIAGLMSNEKGEKVAAKINQLGLKLKEWGCRLESPFTTLSFMSLLVIPEIKISNKGLFDCNEFNFIDIIKS